MKICHIKIKDFRSISQFDEEVGKHNIIVGKNNTGKSNLLWAIYCFYNPKNLNVDDFLKEKHLDEFADQKLQITLTFDKLTEIEEKNNTKYFFNGKIKIKFEAWIDESGKLAYEYHGFIQKVKPLYPSGFDEGIKSLLDNEMPKRPSFDDFSELKQILEDIVPNGRITKDSKLLINKKYYSLHPEIKKEIIEVLNPDKYHGFIKVNDPKTIGECYFIPAIKDPTEDLQTTKTTSPINQMMRSIFQEIKTKDLKKNFKKIQEEVKKERQTNITELQKKFNDELELFSTSVDINLLDIEISDAFPINIDILFNDGVSTPLENKGTGLQRYVLFKFLKIKNDLNLGEDISYILLFEEPEAHLHPQFQREIAKILKNLSDLTNYQTFLTSHSPQFIDLLNLDYVFIFNKEKECTKSNKCELHITEIKEEIKILLLFDPNVKEIFFSEKIVLIEGPSEEILTNILIQEGKLDVSNVSIITARGKFNIPRFLKVFNAIGIPYTVLLDEDPYFLPNYAKKNPSKIANKRKAYKKTIEIADMVEESLGKIIVISPNLDKFLGVSTNQSNNLGKPTAVHEKYKELEVVNDEIIEKIEELFNFLINPENLKHRISNPDGSEWVSQDESSVSVPQPTFDDFKEAIKQNIKVYRGIHDILPDNALEELKNLFNLKKKNTKKSATSRKGPLNNWLKEKTGK